MLERTAGLETEYAIRHSPGGDGPRHSNLTVFRALRDAIGARVATRSGETPLARFLHAEDQRFFVENGGSFNYESISLAPDAGLMEGSTPECRGPTQVVLYQRAQDALLARALDDAEGSLDGGDGARLGLLKNCRDADGNIYGAQENYSCTIARGPRLLLLRLGLVLLAPWTLVVGWSLQLLFVLLLLVGIAIVIALALLLLGGMVAAGLIDLVLAAFRSPTRLGPLVDRAFLWLQGDGSALRRAGSFEPRRTLPLRLAFASDAFLSSMIFLPYAQLLRALAFREVRRDGMAFLISRPILSGAGTLLEGDRFALSEKGPAIRRPMRTTVIGSGYGIVDPGNLVKGALNVIFLEYGAFVRLLRSQQRLQLGLSDSNMAEPAEYLKVGTTMLLLDMVEAGRLRDAPRPRDPVAALHAIVLDPTLKASVPLRDGREMTALELQRYYLDQAKQFVSDAEATSLEARHVVQLWEEALDALESDPGQLVGRLDWVTKRYLLETVQPPEGVDAQAFRKKIDLRYHELRDGYFKQLQEAGMAPRVVEADDVAEAIRAAPPDTRALQRSRLIKQLAYEEAPVSVGWDSVRVGKGLRATVIQLDDHRPH